MKPYYLVEIYRSIRDTYLHLQGKSLISLLPTRWKNLSEILDPHDNDDEEYRILRCDVVYCDKKLSASSSGQKIDSLFYLKADAEGSSELLVNFYRTPLYHIKKTAFFMVTALRI